jgi:hypothetical protein
MNINLSTLGIKILLKCNVKALSMHDVTQLYKSHKKEERDEVIKQLLLDKYIEAIKMPKPNTRKTPTYYLITKKGIKWVQNYLDSFPKK